ncbi:hypothetical protein ACXZ1K_08785 [Pedobacter sp. PWIIR3]
MKRFPQKSTPIFPHTLIYRTYFLDPNNRTWAKETYDIQVHYPKRILVVGRRSDFNTDVWLVIINDYKDIEIMTFDDLINGVTARYI